MTDYLSNLARGISAYTAGEQLSADYVKLNTNENPYPPSPKAVLAFKEYDAKNLRLYPDPDCAKLRDAIAQSEGLDPRNIFCGNGSDEILALCFPAFFDRDGRGVAFADITYSFYPVFADFFGIPKKALPVTESYALDLEAFAKVDAQGLIVCNPNAPTGIAVEPYKIEKVIAAQRDKVVIVDEAYVDFFGKSCADLIRKHSNLIVVKTFSKSYSLAGIRCGYAIADERLIAGLKKVRDCFNSYPVDSLCQTVCAAAVSDAKYYADATAKVVNARKSLTAALVGLGLTVLDSGSNFVFAGGNVNGREVYEKLKSRKVLVRFFDRPRLREYLRITVGTPEQNAVLIRELKNILQEDGI